MDTTDGSQAIYIGASLFKQDEIEILHSHNLCEFLDALNVSVNLIQGDDALDRFMEENGALPDKLSELHQLYGGR